MAFMVGTPAFASGAGLRTTAPPGFEDLASDRELLLDVYYGGRKVGQARATIRPGQLVFADPGEVAGLVPNVASLPELSRALGGPLKANSDRTCGLSRPEGCGTLDPDRAGIILDADRFRVDIFVNPSLLATVNRTGPAYLDRPEGKPSFVSLFGATLSGSSRGDRNYHVQNRSIASVGSMRLRSDSSVANRTGLSFDNLTLEADRKDWRYTGGLFWAPGSSLVGRRKMVGIGAAVQLDTRADRLQLTGTPIDVFLAQPGRVELLVDGRVMTSQIFPAGSRILDTSGLPDGSYDVVVRVQEDGRPAREERRFFTKGTAMAPLGRPLLSAYLGLLPTSNRGLSVDGDKIFYQASAAYRLTRSLGVDATVLGTQDKAVIEAGGVLNTPVAQLRAAALVSSSGDHGALLRASSNTHGPLSFSIDLRTIKSRNGRPLLPVTSSEGTFSQDAETGFADRGSYTQGLAIVGYRLGQANLRLTGLYRDSPSERRTYNIGASVEVPVVRAGRLNIQFTADARKTERDVGAFAGIRFLLNRGNMSYSGFAGASHQSGKGADDTRLVGEAQAALYRELADKTQVSGSVAVGQDLDGAYARASSYVRSAPVNARADLLHQFSDHGGTTQYSATLEGGLAMTGGSLRAGGRELNDSAMIVSVSGGRPGQAFDVLVDESVRGRVTNDHGLLLLLQPYERYDVRLRPSDAEISSFDTAARPVTLYPGNVARLDWKVTPLFVLFGRAVNADGTPVATADIKGGHGIGRSDAQGYFQVETRAGDDLRFTARGGAECRLDLPPAKPVDGYFSAGELVCR
jgi:hypothetical protein